MTVDRHNRLDKSPVGYLVPVTRVARRDEAQWSDASDNVSRICCRLSHIDLMRFF